jgi:thiol:disulfide interchange protein
MPFGAIYGALFFAGLGFWVVFLAGPEPSVQPALVRLFLSVLSGTLALGLLLARPWARWGGVLFSAALAGVTLFVARFAGATAWVLLFGSLATLGLLLLPPTGRLQSAAKCSSMTRDRSVGTLGWTAAVAAIGLLASLWWTGSLPDAGFQRSRGDNAFASRVAERVRWSDFGTGLERARVENKPVLVNFVTNWCGFCQRMDRTTWKHPTVVDRMGDLVAVRVDAEETRERNGYRGSSLAGRYGVTGYPTLLLLDEGGRIVAQTGGYQEPRQLLSWLEQTLSRQGRTGAANLRVSGR